MAIYKCRCANDPQYSSTPGALYQNKTYGHGNRVFTTSGKKNETERTKERCTVCGIGKDGEAKKK